MGDRERVSGKGMRPKVIMVNGMSVMGMRVSGMRVRVAGIKEVMVKRGEGDENDVKNGECEESGDREQ